MQPAGLEGLIHTVDKGLLVPLLQEYSLSAYLTLCVTWVLKYISVFLHI